MKTGTKTEQHTPTPYKIGRIAGTNTFTVGKDNSLTEVFHFDNEMKALEKWIELTGNFPIGIVRAVNSHEALLEIVKFIDSYFDNGNRPSGSALWGPDAKNPTTLAQAIKQAVAQAEGEKP